jgi:hypothetical protein
MGFNRYHAPSPAELAARIYENGPRSILEGRRSIDAIVGETDSVRIVQLLMQEIDSKTEDSQILKQLQLNFPQHFTK